jgi:hypothetical protein
MSLHTISVHRRTRWAIRYAIEEFASTPAVAKPYVAVLGALFCRGIGALDLAILVTVIRALFGKRNTMPPQSSDGSGITERLDRLERENRRLKRLGLASLAVMGSVLVMGQSPAKRILEANEFILRDASGSVRATLKMDKGEPLLTLLDSHGKVEAGPEQIEFEDSNGTNRALLGSHSAIYYQQVEGKTVITDQGPGLLLSGPDGRTRVDLRGMADGAEFLLYGQNSANSTKQVYLSSAGDGPSLTVSDDKGFKSVIGSVSLSIPSTGGSSRTSAASIVLFDKDGKVIWNVP